jgi:cell division transport system permease protein
MAIKLEYAIQESVTNIRRNFFITTAAIVVVAVSLSLLGGALLVGRAIKRTTNLWTGNVRVSIFLCEPGNARCLSADEKTALEEELRTMQEVRTVDFETKQEAYANFKRLFANQPALLRNTPVEAMPESFRVQLKDPSQFKVIADRFTGRPGVTVRDERQFLDQLFSLANRLRTLATWLAAVVLFAALLLVATTIRMAIYARRKEIRIMKLVGATNWFIPIPFMVEGMVQGAIGAVAAVLLLMAAKPFLFTNLTNEGLANLRVSVGLVEIAVFGIYIVVAGIILGALGSLIGLRGYLDT